MIKLAVIGASYLQEPLIQKAKELGMETHVFAWAANDVGEKSADHFYPVSIIEKEKILEICCEIGIDGICSISSDLAAITVNYVASKMGLPGNTMESCENSTNKFRMRRCFEENGDPSPRSLRVRSVSELDGVSLLYPVIVKPVDRSGSRGITKLTGPGGMEDAIRFAMEQGFDDCALVEEYAHGKEYSVECISYHGEHHLLAITEKFTTGSPHFIETGHLEPAPLSEEMREKVRDTVFHALGSLGITDSASHSELKIDQQGNIRLIEIGGRMGGDFIGSDLVRLTTGIDFVRAVIDVALGKEPDLTPREACGAAAVRFVFSQEDIRVLETVREEHPEYLFREDTGEIRDAEVLDSSQRYGYYLLRADSAKELEPYLPV